VKVIYVAPLFTEDIEDRYDVEWYSPAGQNKMRGMIRALSTAGATVVVSPVVPPETLFSYTPTYRTTESESGAEVIVPPAVSVLRSKLLTRFLVTLMTTLAVIRLCRRPAVRGAVFYNFRLITAVPALAAQLVTGRPAILEYEDGLFTHRSTPIRLVARGLLRATNGRLHGALCVNTNLAARLSTDNVAIVRGFPSVGLPDELPDPVHDSDGVVVMFAGHFDEVRGIDTFLSVVPEVAGEDVTFWVSGTGRDHEIERVRTAVDQLDDDRVEFFGTLPWEQYRERLVSADVLVNLQDPDAEISEYTFPSKLLDFMSAGGLIVSTDMSDLAETFDDEMLIAGTTQEEIVDTLEAAVEMVRTGSGRRDVGREWVRQNCTSERIGEAAMEVINAAAAES